MARIVVRSLGPVRGPWREAAQEYLLRLRGHLPLEWEELQEVRAAPKAGAAEERRVRAREASLLLQGLPAAARIFALDAKGEGHSSEEFAQVLAAWRAEQDPVFLLIGGHLGLDDGVLRHAQLLSLSRLTFSHQMVPAILFEQIYRAQTILEGGPYHR